MLKRKRDIYGNFLGGSICCDNKSCNKVLFTWVDEKDNPDDYRSGSFAYSVKTRLLFSRFPTDLALAPFQPLGLFTIKDRVVGYILDFNVLPLKLDFCSGECSLAWLGDNNNYGVILYGENPQEQNTFVADDATRFVSIAIGNFPASSAPKNQYHLPKGQRINIAGKTYVVRRANMLRVGENEPAIGVEMTTLMLKCPMKIESGDTHSHICNQLIQVIVEFTPSVWICPRCNGMIIFDKVSNSSRHLDANLNNDLPLGNFTISANYYFGKHDWGNRVFVNWLKNEIGVQVFAIADAYQDTGMFSNSFVTQSLENIDTVVNLFEHLIS